MHLVCRNKSRADEARAHIVEQSKNEVKREIFILKTIALILSCHSERHVFIPMFCFFFFAFSATVHFKCFKELLTPAV